MNFLSRVFPTHVNWAFVLALGIFWLALMGGVAHNESGTVASEHTMIQPANALSTENFGQRLAELNSAINQSMAWEGAGFKASQINALDQRIVNALDRFAEDLLSAQAKPGLTAAQTELLKQIQIDFAGYRKTALDVLDIKSGMLGNAASFMTVIEGRYAEMSGQLAQLREMERTVSVASMAQGHALAQQDTQWLIAIAGFGLGAAVIWLGGRFFTSRIERQTRFDGAQVQESAGPTFRHVLGRVDPSTNEERSERLKRILEELRRAKQSMERDGGYPPRVAAVPLAAPKVVTDLGTTADVSKGSDNINTVVSQTCHWVDEGAPAINAVAHDMQKIDEGAQKIAQTIGVFDLIAFETNVLALSAVDKSARLGEQRQDAAAMAQEWLRLAKTGRDAAREIRTLFGGLLAQVRAGTAHAQSAGDAMVRIAGGVRQVSMELQHFPQVVSGKGAVWGRGARRSHKRTKSSSHTTSWWSTQHPWNLRHGKNKVSN